MGLVVCVRDAHHSGQLGLPPVDGVAMRKKCDEAPRYNITDNFPPGVETSMFADDLAIWSSHRNIAEAEAKLQQALDTLATWTEKWKMTVSVPAGSK